MIDLSTYIFGNFHNKWKKLKPTIKKIHLAVFYDLVDIDNTTGRRIYPYCGREYNPKFYTHWFSCGRCHWNVVLPCFMLNDNRFTGDWKIITNDDHSAIINEKLNIIYCPTLDEKDTVLNMLNAKDTEIIECIEHFPACIEPDNLDFFLKKLVSMRSKYLKDILEDLKLLTKKSKKKKK